MKKYELLLVTAVIIFLLSLSVVTYADEIRIKASAVSAENILKPIKKHFERESGIKLQIAFTDPKLALEDLENGAVDAVTIGFSCNDWMDSMKKEKTKIKDLTSLQHVVIGKAKIAIFVHKENPVSKLSKEQLKRIFTGNITNWKDVGGKNLPVVVVWSTLTSEINSLFIKNILDCESPRRDILEALTIEDVKQKVAAHPEAVGIGSVAVVNDTSVYSGTHEEKCSVCDLTWMEEEIKALEVPEVVMPILLLTKGNPTVNVQKLIDFIKGEGQKYISQQ